MRVYSDLMLASYTHTGHMQTCPFWSADRTRSSESLAIFRETPLFRTATPSSCGIAPCVSRHARNLGASNYPHRTRHAGSRIHGPPKDGFQATTAAATRREQKIAAPTRQLCESSRSWAQHGAREWSASRQSEGAAAARRPPLAAFTSRRQAENLLWDGVIRSHGQ